MNARLRAFMQRADVLTAIASGVAYGLVAQCVVRLEALRGLFGVMSFGYVFVLPAVLGFVTAQLLEPGRGLWRTLLACCTTGIVCLLAALLVGWEGTICLVMAAPVYLLLSVVGGLVGYALRRRRGQPVQRHVWPVLLALPLASAALESRTEALPETRVVANAIEIDAPSALVWQHIARVAPITEHQESFFYTMGFPRPIEATLSHEGVGGVRHARFEHGLRFIETVTTWEPPRVLSFAIAAAPDQTPLTTLDAHVVVGGRYFDVLEGGYRIVPLSPTRVRLELESRHRISTRFNAYTALWSDFLMGDIQANILRVLKERCERAARG